MKVTKIIISILLAAAALFVGYLSIDSVLTPIQFEETKAEREAKIQERLLDLRTAVNEYKIVNGCYTDNLDSLVYFLKNTPKREIYKEGSLSEDQMKRKLTEDSIAKTLYKARLEVLKKNPELEKVSLDSLYTYVWQEDIVIKDSLVGFRRDTLESNMIQTLYGGKYTEKTIDEIKYIPYGKDNAKFAVEVDNEYTTSTIAMPLIQISAHYNEYLYDLDAQELVNLIDKVEKLNEEKLAKDPFAEPNFAGTKIGSLYGPNNNAGNWE
ncbi:MAG: hypothetical protein II248_00655 [Paludibacteraceae bacterium]|nr:hypothetical protein [Paludibacteraceae bacterium]